MTTPASGGFLVVALDIALIRFGIAMTRGQNMVGASSMNFEKYSPLERHEAVMRWLRAVLDGVREDGALCAIESQWVGKNAQTTIKLCRLQGACIEAAETRGYEVALVQPAEWQEDAGITLRRGRWRAKSKEIKRESLRIAAARTGMPIENLTEDAADAVNIAFSAYGRALRRRRASAA